MTQTVAYERETKSVAFQGKIIVLESLTPVLPPKEKERKRWIVRTYTKQEQTCMIKTDLLLSY
uniref:hypothetical protein n=1 Tax=Acetatifactor aquisgranensis TaxID=2941233 RepID=UPI00204212E6